MEHKRIILRTQSELIAFVPHLLGFHVDDALVVVPTDRPGPHARLDLPKTQEDRAEAALALREGYLRSPGAVVLIAFSDDHDCAEAAIDVCADLTSGVLRIEDRLLTHDGTWESLNSGKTGIVSQEDVSRFAAERVVGGHLAPANSRDSLAEQLRGADTGLVGAHLPVEMARVDAIGGQPVELAVEARWVTEAVEAFIGTQRPLPDPDAARMLADIQHIDLRDTAWCLMQRSQAPEHAALWHDLTRRAPQEVKTPAAALLAFAAWCNGDGARALIALDQIADPEKYNLAMLVAKALHNGAPPSVWTPSSSGADRSETSHNADRAQLRNRQLRERMGPPANPTRDYPGGPTR